MTASSQISKTTRADDSSIVVGTSRDNVLNGPSGTATLIGNGGDDTYVFGAKSTSGTTDALSSNRRARSRPRHRRNRRTGVRQSNTRPMPPISPARPVLVRRHGISGLMPEVKAIIGLRPDLGPLLYPGYDAVGACLNDNLIQIGHPLVRRGPDECPEVTQAIADRAKPPAAETPAKKGVHAQPLGIFDGRFW